MQIQFPYKLPQLLYLIILYHYYEIRWISSIIYLYYILGAYNMYDHLEEIENEFKEVHEDNEKNTPDPRTQAIYRNNLLLYLGYIILPIVLSIFIVIGLSDNDFFFKDVNPSEHAIEGAVSDVNALLFVDPTYFDNLDPLYQSFVTPVGSDGRITIYVHSSATFID